MSGSHCDLGACITKVAIMSVGSPGHHAARPLRHTCASLSVSAGVNVLALQRMLGHTSAKMTLDTYSDLFDDDLDAVAGSCTACTGRSPATSGGARRKSHGAQRPQF